jgi:hypothetical protein
MQGVFYCLRSFSFHSIFAFLLSFFQQHRWPPEHFLSSDATKFMASAYFNVTSTLEKKEKTPLAVMTQPA